MARSRAKDEPYASLLGVSRQGLLDLAASGASDVVFVRERRAPPGPFLDALEKIALESDFAVASMAVGVDHAFDALDEVVRGFAKNLRVDGLEARGLIALLDGFVAREKRGALDTFDERAAALGAAGDITRLARAYVEAKSEPKAELRALRGYLEGRDPAGVALEETRSTLTPRTAKRTLVDLSRLVRVLGHAGLLLVARRAASLTELSPTRRENAYTVLRELCDNGDGPRGALSTRLVVSGADELFAGPRSMLESAPLTTRILFDDDADALAMPPVPHGTVLVLPDRTVDDDDRVALREPDAPTDKRARSVGALVRAGMGLPPLYHLDDLTVGYESVDATLDRLFEHASNEGSVFSLLSGAYGSGKTHLLMHVTARALAERRPVLRLSVESLDADLGNPQRHLRRLLEGALLPGAGAPSPLDRLGVWTRTDASTRKLARKLEEIAAVGSDASNAARRALRALASGEPRALEVCLGARDLESRPSQPSYRQDAYGRLLLWVELLTSLDGCDGPVLLIDEAENLYKGGTTRPERRTALRTLAFYCGGALPRACVIFAVTPETLTLLRDEAESMLDEVADQVTSLPWEDATLLRRRLLRSRALDVAKLGKEELRELALRARQLHAAARGAVRDREIESFVEETIRGKPTARDVVRRTIARLEATWWWGQPS